MPTRPEQGLLDLIDRGDPFSATSDDGSMSLQVDTWIPCICAAIHDGHRMRDDLSSRCLLTPEERLREEDPHTGGLVSSMPITLVAHDSRYEYDLNRPLAQCVSKKAWGRMVWRKQPTQRQHTRSRARHSSFYAVLDALVAAVEKRFGACLVMDVHSYNMGRQDASAPTFNLGTSQIDMDRWGGVINRLSSSLGSMELPGLPVSVKKDTVFQGRGYLIAHINARFTDTLVIPTEVGKVFMDEETCETYPLVLEALATGFKYAASDTAAYFSRKHTRRARTRRLDMLSSGIDDNLRDVDIALYKLAQNLETLMYVSPVNTPAARRAYERNGRTPQFIYKPLDLDPYRFRAMLYRLPVESIADPEIQRLYHAVIDSLAGRIDLLTSVDSERFVYNSLRHYGEPDEQDIANAKFILHATAHLEPEPEATITAPVAQQILKAQAEAWGMECRVERSRRLVAKALVDNYRRTLVINSDAMFTETQVQALAHHELGVHMATTLNARKQPLRIFSLGMPLNTLTQEGLAILAEFLSGNLTLDRLRGLALRVVAVKLMLRFHDFNQTAHTLIEEYGISVADAFNLSVRVHRGGGFSKDYLYLRGLREAYACWTTRSLETLLVGKTSLTWHSLIDELRARDVVKQPSFVPKVFTEPVEPDPVVAFVVQSIQATRRSVL